MVFLGHIEFSMVCKIGGNRSMKPIAPCDLAMERLEWINSNVLTKEAKECVKKQICPLCGGKITSYDFTKLADNAWYRCSKCGAQYGDYQELITWDEKEKVLG